jgi:hypothetical protein
MRSPTRLGMLGLLLALTSGVGAEGSLRLRWSGLTENDGTALDYHDLRSYLRYRAPVDALNGALHLRGWVRQGGAEPTPTDSTATLRRFDRRLQLRRASLTGIAADRLHWEAGRHRPDLASASPLEADGVTTRLTRGAFHVAATVGTVVPYWEADALTSGDLQIGVEAGVAAAGYDIGTGLLRDVDAFGESRWRLAARSRVSIRPGLGAGLYLDADPAAGRWLRGGGHLSWRGGPWSLAVHAAEREIDAFPAAWVGHADSLVVADSRRFGGRNHEWGGRAQRQWGRNLRLGLSVRSHTGARQFRREELYLFWRGFPLRRGILRLSLSDSWSPWRQVEQARLDYAWTGWRRWSLAAGGVASLFRWETSRSPEWQTRFRPHLDIRWRPTGAWSTHLRLEESIDEFGHLRTRADVTVGVRL